MDEKGKKCMCELCLSEWECAHGCEPRELTQDDDTVYRQVPKQDEPEQSWFSLTPAFV